MVRQETPKEALEARKANRRWTSHEKQRQLAFDHLDPQLGKLLHITRGCRPDMHEPDEQGLVAAVIGTRLDNAGVDGELTVLLERNEKESLVIKLADLIALARLASMEALR